MRLTGWLVMLARTVGKPQEWITFCRAEDVAVDTEEVIRATGELADTLCLSLWFAGGAGPLCAEQAQPIWLTDTTGIARTAA